MAYEPRAFNTPRTSYTDENKNLSDDDSYQHHSSGTLSEVDDSDGNNDDTLTEFREAWKNELASRQASCQSKKRNNPSADTIESQAREWFEKGVALERNRKLYDAVTCYRKAMQLMPDIEFKYYHDLRQQQQKKPKEDQDNSGEIQSAIKSNEDSEVMEEEEDLVSKFEKLNVDEMGNFCLCKPEVFTKKTHFSSLPIEVVHYICKWVVSLDFDFRSLEQLSHVCRGLYVISRDPEIWKLACQKIWSNCATKSLSEFDGDWRKMFIEKPRVNFNGVYISRATYVRQGEAAFRDADYKPCYLVEYYRYFRFFPDGVVLMLNTPDEPHQCLPKLRFRAVRHPSVIRGRYELCDSVITAVLKRTQRSQPDSTSRYKRNHLKDVQIMEQEFRIVLEVKTVKGRRNVQLTWKAYSVTCRRTNCPETVTTFDLSQSKFPPFYFSRVKSYSSEAQSPIG